MPHTKPQLCATQPAFEICAHYWARGPLVAPLDFTFARERVGALVGAEDTEGKPIISRKSFRNAAIAGSERSSAARSASLPAWRKSGIASAAYSCVHSGGALAAKYLSAFSACSPLLPRVVRA